MQRLLTIIYYLSLAVVAGFVGIMLLTVFPIPGTDYDLRVVQSGSMEPALKTGSLIFIRPVEEPKVTDIITYRRPNQKTPITHRVIEVETENDQTRYITKGDANQVRDMEPVTEEMILGQVTFTLPWIGHGIELARSRIGFTLLIIVPALLIGLDEIKKIRRNLKPSDPDTDI